MSEYMITYENDFPFVLYVATEMSATPRTSVIRRSDYQYCTVEFVRAGAGILEIDGKTFQVKENGVYFLTPGSTHAYWPDRSNPWVKLFFVIGGTMMTDLLKAYKMEQIYHIPDCPELKKYFEQMKTLQYNSVVSNPQASVIFHQFLQEASTLVYGVKSQLPKDVEALKLALDNALGMNFRLEEFAEEQSVSEAHLIRKFKHYFGMTPYEYLMTGKIETARHLLLYSALSVKEISARMGFSDQYYFSNYFKLRTGLAPRLYRSRFQQKKSQN